MAHSPSQPAPPDPAIQTSNEAAANRYDINSPFGKQTWQQSGPETIGYDSKGQPITGQHYTQNIELDPSEQRQFDTRNQISELLMNQGKEGIGKGLPEYHDTGSPLQVPDSIKNPKSLGEFDINKASSPAADAQFQRTMNYLQPYLDRQSKSKEQELANEGLPLGSQAYKEAHDILADEQNRTVSDAASGAAAMAPTIALQGRQQQESELGGDFGRELGGFGAQQSQVGQQLQQDIGKRQQYYNEIAAALGGQQLNPINAGGGGGDSALNVANAFQQYNSGVMNNYNQKQASTNAINTALINAAGSLGGGAMRMSDERVKYDIEPIGELASGDEVYEYHYDWESPDEDKHVGVMAQDIEQVDPEGVIQGSDGIKRVDYRRVIARAMLAQAA
jgi:hypothetical protein